MSNALSTYLLPLQSDLSRVPEDLLWYMTGAFLILALCYLGSVFYFRTRLKLKSGQEADRKKLLAPMIGKFLFYTEQDPLEVKREYVQLKIEIRELIKDGLTRKVLSEVLQDLKKDVSGSTRQQLLKLYQDLGLAEDAMENLNSRRWEVLSRAILELTQMEVQGAYGLIRKHINHRRSIVRKQAQIATVSLKNDGIIYFLDTNRYPISEWQQLKLLDVLRHLEDFNPPRFNRWLTSKNKDVVLFALRLLKYYKQNNATASLIRLVNHRNQQVKLEAIQCIREFFIEEAKESLKKAYSKGNEEVKLLIMDTLGLLGGEDDINFLQNIVKNSFTHIISSKALSVINTIKPESILPEEDIELTEEMIPDLVDPKPEVMEKEEKAVPSIQLPQPDFKADPMRWEDMLNPDFEDELIFSHCCLEEFRDLIDEIGEPILQTGDPGTLPLDFLPLVVKEKTEVKVDQKEMPENELSINEISTNNPQDNTVHAEERITEVIEALIAMENKEQPPSQNEHEEDVFNIDFLPILVDDKEAEALEKEEKARQELYTLEVISETLKGQVPEAFTESERLRTNYNLQIPPEESFEAVKAINWSEIAAKNLEISLPEAEEIEERLPEQDPDFPYGFSIFHELFRAADPESKMILLDEVLAIGDEKELHFLKSLAEDPSPLIRKKAAQIEKDLAAKLFPKDENTSNTKVGNVHQETPLTAAESEEEVAYDEEPDITGLLDLCFEPEIEVAAVNSESIEVEETEDESGGSGPFMSRFTALTHKILERIYG